MSLKIGDFVTPKQEWIDDPNRVPTGQVRALAMSGFAAYVGDERRAFGAYVFNVIEPEPVQADIKAPSQT